MASLIIGSTTFALESFLEFDQTYREQSASNFRRTANGSGILRSVWAGKLSTTINGAGWTPGALEDIDQTATQEIQCLMPRAVSDVGTSITLPIGRRSDTDHDPAGFAIVDGLLVSTPITNLANINAGTEDVAALTAVSGATGYRVNYWPRFTAAITNLSIVGRSSARFEFQIEAEEV